MVIVSRNRVGGLGRTYEDRKGDIQAGRDRQMTVKKKNGQAVDGGKK